jgi:hypothetical protein
METYNYNEALNLVEKFMDESGVRAYCTEVCLGKCCFACSLRTEKGCGDKIRHLACSLHICSLILKALPEEAVKRFRKLKSKVFLAINEAWLKRKRYFDVYFETIPTAVKRNFVIDREIIDEMLNPEFVALLKQRVNFLMS